MSIEDNKLKNILEAALMAVGKPMTIEQMMKLFGDDDRPSATRVKEALQSLQQDCEGRGIELKDIASGYRYQARQDYSEWLSRLWEEKPAKYSRAYLETLALIAYRQPVTRAEIEEVRGVSVSSNIVKTMLEREWIRVVGHRDVPGRPSLYATTKQFLDYFNMKSLEELPSLAEIKDLEELSPELGLTEPGQEESLNAEMVDTDELANDAESLLEESTVDTDSSADFNEPDSDIEDSESDDEVQDYVAQGLEENSNSESSDMESASDSIDANSTDIESSEAEIEQVVADEVVEEFIEDSFSVEQATEESAEEKDLN